MDTQLLIICARTFVIHVIATLAYAVRIAGVRTRRIAVSFSLFGIIVRIAELIWCGVHSHMLLTSFDDDCVHRGKQLR